jgi:streptogramin lyase
LSATPVLLRPAASLPARGSQPGGLAWDGRQLWQADLAAETVYRLDPASGRVTSSFKAPGVQSGLTFDGRYLWLLTGKPRRLRCVDPATGRPIREYVLQPPTDHATGLAPDGEDRVWVAIENLARLQLRGLTDGSVVRELAVRPRPGGVAATDTSVWYTEPAEAMLVRVNKANGRELVRFRLSGRPGALTWDGQRLWYVDTEGRKLVAVVP